MPFRVVRALLAQAASPRAILFCQETQVGDMAVIEADSLLHVFWPRCWTAGMGDEEKSRLLRYIFLRREMPPPLEIERAVLGDFRSGAWCCMSVRQTAAARAGHERSA